MPSCEGRDCNLFTYGHPSLSCKLRQDDAEAKIVVAIAGGIAVTTGNPQVREVCIVPTTAAVHAVRAFSVATHFYKNVFRFLTRGHAPLSYVECPHVEKNFDRLRRYILLVLPFASLPLRFWQNSFAYTKGIGMSQEKLRQDDAEAKKVAANAGGIAVTTGNPQVREVCIDPTTAAVHAVRAMCIFAPFPHISAHIMNA